jgi:hypothetical protein
VNVEPLSCGMHITRLEEMVDMFRSFKVEMPNSNWNIFAVSRFLRFSFELALVSSLIDASVNNIGLNRLTYKTEEVH